ncbi:MAG: hypothetical protein C9356_12710 [Oleiphilus sp.]|nr:MAG: hypothetical protein C9356_12710 [Oleiphilus sp.]
MKVAIMQPYFYPYIGYFQLINAVDTFVLYDDIEYVKQSWMNRNRILVNGQPAFITLPLKKDSDYLHVNKRYLAGTWLKERKKLMQRVKGAYNKAPFFAEVYGLVCNGLNCDALNLFGFLHYNLQLVLDFLEIETKVVISSSLGDFYDKKSSEKVLAICHSLQANQYINPIGGVELYKKNEFAQRDIELKFLETQSFDYEQFGNEFQVFLSIIDVLMFNGKNKTRDLIEQYYYLR